MYDPVKNNPTPLHKRCACVQDCLLLVRWAWQRRRRVARLTSRRRAPTPRTSSSWRSSRAGCDSAGPILPPWTSGRARRCPADCCICPAAQLACICVLSSRHFPVAQASTEVISTVINKSTALTLYRPQAGKGLYTGILCGAGRICHGRGRPPRAAGVCGVAAVVDRVTARCHPCIFPAEHRGHPGDRHSRCPPGRCLPAAALHRHAYIS